MNNTMTETRTITVCLMNGSHITHECQITEMRDVAGHVTVSDGESTFEAWDLQRDKERDVFLADSWKRI